jgi:hypothetical protein
MKAYIVSDCGSRYPHEDGKWYQRDEVDGEIAALKAEVEQLRECNEKQEGEAGGEFTRQKLLDACDEAYRAWQEADRAWHDAHCALLEYDGKQEGE